MKHKVGAIYWYPVAPEPTMIPHPYVIIDETRECVSMCRITSNRKKQSWPGNVTLSAGEANLHRISIVEASQLIEVPKADLGEFIGALSSERVHEISHGVRIVEGIRRRHE